MDDDDMRRADDLSSRLRRSDRDSGGDALQASALRCSRTNRWTGERRSGLEMLRVLVRATAPRHGGRPGGHLAAVGQKLSIGAVENMHRRKTGRAISAGVARSCGGVSGGRELASPATSAPRSGSRPDQDDIPTSRVTALLGKSRAPTPRMQPTIPARGLAARA